MQKSQSALKAIFVSFNFKQFWGLLVEFEEFYSNFSVSKGRDFLCSKSRFFQFQGPQSIGKPNVSAKNQCKFKAICVSFNLKQFLSEDFHLYFIFKLKATCVSFNLKQFWGQLVEFEEFYSNFSVSNLRNFWQYKGWFSQFQGLKIKVNQMLAPKNSLHPKLHELASIWNIFQVNWSNLKY